MLGRQTGRRWTRRGVDPHVSRELQAKAAPRRRQTISRIAGRASAVSPTGTASEGQPVISVRISLASSPTRLMSSNFVPVIDGFQAKTCPAQALDSYRGAHYTVCNPAVILPRVAILPVSLGRT